MMGQSIKTLVIAFTLSMCALAPQAVLAAFGGMGQETPHIETDPAFIGPNVRFTARLVDNSTVLGGGDITWTVDGKAYPEGDNSETVTLTAPNSGTPLKIEVRRQGVDYAVSQTILGQSIDLITESDTKAPYFYQGRRVPSLGTTAHLVAVPNLYDAKGKRIADKDIVYTWEVDNRIVNSGGKGAVTVQVSPMGAPVVLLSASLRDGSPLFKRTFYIEVAEPSLEFYIVNPLNGLSRNAVQDKYYPATGEVNVRAEPYAIKDDIYRNAEYGWTINGSKVANAKNDPQLITLQKAGNGGTSNIGFSLFNLDVLSQYVENTFRIDFK